MPTVLCHANAKINLSLDVVCRRPDGYHELKTVMQSLDLCDRIELRCEAGDGISLHTNLSYLPCSPKNIAWKAAEAYLARIGKKRAVSIHIEKHVPVCAGLGGGSADGAAVLRGMNELMGGALSRAELMALGATLGADVPFCLQRNAAYATGIGEILTSISPLPDCAVLLVKPPINISTVSVFTKLDLSRIRRHPDTEGLLQAMEQRNLANIACRCYNVLEPMNAGRFPILRQLRQGMLEFDALGVVMSGSGPTMVGIFHDDAAAGKAASKLGRNGCQSFVCHPLREE